ncbi:MAG TPA: GspH/FimT family pseudopilin [Gammaproteobacteria bacterium]
MRTQEQRGFTLLELLVAITVAGILLGVGIPSFREFQRNSAMASAANELLTATLLARAEAVKRQVPVTLCLSANFDAAAPTCAAGAAANSSTVGFIVWVDESGAEDANGSPVITDATDGDHVVNDTLNGDDLIILRRSPPPGGTITISADAGFVTFMPSGYPRRPFAGRTVLFCDDRGNRAAGGLSSARAVRIDATGRGQVLTEVDDIEGALADIGGAASCP